MQDPSELERWERRYADGRDQYPDGRDAHPLVVEWLRRRSGGTALDLAAGSGRHSLVLAGAGFAVTAVDFAPSAVAGLERVMAAAGHPVTATVADLFQYTPEQAFDVVLNAFFHADAGLAGRAVRWLAPGGELWWITHAPSSPVGPPAHLVRPGVDDVLASARGGGVDLEVLVAEELPGPGEDVDVVVRCRRS